MLSSGHVKKLLEGGKNIVILGAPGSGKGTYAKRLAPLLKIPHISSGDLLRQHISDRTAIGKQVSAITKRGDLVGDDILMEVIKERLSKADASRGFILDGVPRTNPQCAALEEIAPIHLSLEVFLNEEILVEKALARRICPSCNASYNLFSIDTAEYKMGALLPKRKGLCDRCGSALVQRPDDTRPTVLKRLALFKENYGAVSQHYLSRGVHLRFELKQGVDVMWPILRAKFAE